MTLPYSQAYHGTTPPDLWEYVQLPSEERISLRRKTLCGRPKCELKLRPCSDIRADPAVEAKLAGTAAPDPAPIAEEPKRASVKAKRKLPTGVQRLICKDCRQILYCSMACHKRDKDRHVAECQFNKPNMLTMVILEDAAGVMLALAADATRCFKQYGGRYIIEYARKVGYKPTIDVLDMILTKGLVKAIETNDRTLALDCVEAGATVTPEHIALAHAELATALRDKAQAMAEAEKAEVKSKYVEARGAAAAAPESKTKESIMSQLVEEAKQRVEAKEGYQIDALEHELDAQKRTVATWEARERRLAPELRGMHSKELVLRRQRISDIEATLSKLKHIRDLEEALVVKIESPERLAEIEAMLPGLKKEALEVGIILPAPTEEEFAAIQAAVERDAPLLDQAEADALADGLAQAKIAAEQVLTAAATPKCNKCGECKGKLQVVHNAWGAALCEECIAEFDKWQREFEAEFLQTSSPAAAVHAPEPSPVLAVVSAPEPPAVPSFAPSSDPEPDLVEPLAALAIADPAPANESLKETVEEQKA